MVLKAILESLDGVSDELKKEYTEKDGKFYLDVEPVGDFALENVAGLRSTVTREREAAREAKAQLKSKTEEVTRLNEQLAEINDLDETQIEEKHKKAYESKLGQLERTHTAKLEEKDSRIKTLVSQVDDVLGEQKILQAIASHEPRGKAHILLPIVRERLKFRDTDEGKREAFISEPNSEHPMLSPKDSSRPINADEFIAHLFGSGDYNGAFEGSGAKGSGGGSSDGVPSKGSSGGASGGDGSGDILKIDAGDQEAINQHWEKLASGEAELVESK